MKTRKGIFITATDTGVGKTLFCAGLAVSLKSKGIDVGVMKPVASGAFLLKGRRLVSSDADILIKAASADDNYDLINPYIFKKPLAPNVAAKFEGKLISTRRIVNCFDELSKKHQFVIVEGAGGLLTPITDNFSMLDLVCGLDLGIVIISRLSLGTINHTLLTIESARNRGVEVVGVVFNSINKKRDFASRINLDIISDVGDVEVLGLIPHINDLNVINIGKTINKNINIKKIITEKTQRQVWYSKRLKERDKKFIWHPFTQMKDYLAQEPLVIDEGNGIYLKDSDGKCYIDGVSSLWVNVHGHRNKILDEAMRRQLSKISHSTLLGLANTASIELAQRLVQIAPKGLVKVFYSDNGSTAVEVALKMAFQYWQQVNHPRKIKFITFQEAYHGDTIGSVSLGGIDLFHKIYKPMLFDTIKSPSPYCYRCVFKKSYPSCKFECLDRLESLMKKNRKVTAALVIEPLVQGAAGMIVQPQGFLKEVRRLCLKFNIFMIADEVATGFGRTGRMFACEHENISPDIMTLAKGLSGGYLPIAATITSEKIFKGFLFDYKDKKTFFHGHTYTGNPLASAVAIANLDMFKKGRVLEKIQPKIKILSHLLDRFKGLGHVGDIRQMGFMVGIELVKDKLTREPYQWQEKIGIKVVQQARRYGLILRPLGNVIVLMPPLVTSEEELRKIVDITYDVIKKVTLDTPIIM